MTEAVSSYTQRLRKDCLRKIFRDARQGVCLYTRIEEKTKKRAKQCLTDIVSIVTKDDCRFEKIFIKCTDKYKLNLYWEINLGHENKSMYLHKGSVSVTAIGLQAESKQLWVDEISQKDGDSFLNAHAVNILLHLRMRKALTEYSRSDQWKERMKELKLHSIGLEDVCKLHLYFSKELNDSRIHIEVDVIPTIKIHDYCQPYAKQEFGENITHFIAQPKHSNTTFHPSLQWIPSYHEQEQVAIATFPTKICMDSYYGVLLMLESDVNLKMLSREIATHVFLETTHHMSRWMEMHFGNDEHLKDEDHNALMDTFFRKLRQKLESNFVPNYFNPEINLLEVHGITYNYVTLIINKLKAILRGNCECCRNLLKSNVRKFNENTKKVKKQKEKENAV